jgi:hypothetical protein
MRVDERVDATGCGSESARADENVDEMAGGLGECGCMWACAVLQSIVSPSILVGTVTFAVCPNPSCPALFAPNPYAAPSLYMSCVRWYTGEDVRVSVSVCECVSVRV